MIQTRKSPSLIQTKSFEYALKIIEASKYLQNDKGEYILSKQLIRSGTSIGANIREALYAQSKSDFIHKLSISLKEAKESQYWIELLYKTNYLSKVKFDSLFFPNEELIKLLTSSINTAKRNMKTTNS